MKAIDIFDEVIDKTSEYLEMLEAEEASSAILNLLCQMVIRERQDKEMYKKMYEDKISKEYRLNS